MDVAGNGSVEADIARLLDLPQLASVKRLASALAESILEDLPDPSAVDKAQLLRKCAAIVVLAEQEGQRKVDPLVETNRQLVEVYGRRIEQLEEGLSALDDEKDALRAVALEQEALITAQSRLLDAAAEGVAFRELRLPH